MTFVRGDLEVPLFHYCKSSSRFFFRFNISDSRKEVPLGTPPSRDTGKKNPPFEGRELVYKIGFQESDRRDLIARHLGDCQAVNLVAVTWAAFELVESHSY